jgi:hypothetical protein
MPIRSFDGWGRAPRVAVFLPPEAAPGWADAAFWFALLEAWGIPAEPIEAGRIGRDHAPTSEPGPSGPTTVIVPAVVLRTEQAATTVSRCVSRGASLLVVGGVAGPHRVVGVRLDHPYLRTWASACVPPPDPSGFVPVAPHRAGFEDREAAWEVLATWFPSPDSMPPLPAVAVCRLGERTSVWFGISIEHIDQHALEAVVAVAEIALEIASPAGLIALWRWPRASTAALVVDGDVDHPTGVDPECARYVKPALETARRAGFAAYGIFAAGANVDHEPTSFPPAPGYYNHSYHHPYSYWDRRSWADLAEGEMEHELKLCDDAFRRNLGHGDERIFRLPHFQLEASERTYRVLDRLGYIAESSVGANVAITGGLPYHPARHAWGPRPADAAYARTHPDPAGRHHVLQLPISSDPTAPDFPNGCCSYNTLDEGVRNRSARPVDYEAVLDGVVDRALARRGLAHLFIDPPDAGYGRLPGDGRDYGGAVERWLARWAGRPDLAVLTTAELARWWLAREAALGRLQCRTVEGRLLVELEDPPEGATLAVLPPRRIGEEGKRGWTLEEL